MREALLAPILIFAIDQKIITARNLPWLKSRIFSQGIGRSTLHLTN